LFRQWIAIGKLVFVIFFGSLQKIRIIKKINPHNQKFVAPDRSIVGSQNSEKNPISIFFAFTAFIYWDQ